MEWKVRAGRYFLFTNAEKFGRGKMKPDFWESSFIEQTITATRLHQSRGFRNAIFDFESIEVVWGISVRTQIVIYCNCKRVKWKVLETFSTDQLAHFSEARNCPRARHPEVPLIRHKSNLLPLLRRSTFTIRSLFVECFKCFTNLM